ncbi:MAG: lanthionine synthetase LanC family protein [Acidobacteriota bacterium]
MNITDPVVLRHDVLLIPVGELAEELREKFASDEGDFTLSRIHGRTPSQIIDGETASLLQLFRQPRTIVDAVIASSRDLKKDPEAWLAELLPHIGTFLTNRVLVPAGSEDERDFDQSLQNGSSIGPWQVLHCLSMIEDSEIYRVKDGVRDAALKISTRALPFEHSLFGNEARVLSRNEAAATPRLFDSGMHEGRPYLVIEWCPGADASTATAQKRHDRAALLAAACGIADRYTQLHESGVMHGDVHPRNVIVDDDGTVRLIDFGLASIAGEATRVGRGGLYYFYEPELLEAEASGGTLPVTFAGEQYSLAALLYFLIAGNHYLDFRYERDEMVRQVRTEEPLPFVRHGLAPWPEVEALLGRALSKDPAQRFASTGELAAALRSAHTAVVAEALATPVSAEAKEFLEKRLAMFGRGGELFESGYTEAPTASINFGAAGAAVGLLRVAEVRGDPALLALGEVWKARAYRQIGNEEGWYNAAIDLEPAMLGEVTPYHTESGAHAAAALIAHGRGDVLAHRLALERFMAAASRPCPNLDLTLGKSATLIGAAILNEISSDLPEAAGLMQLGKTTLDAVWQELDQRPPLADNPPQTYLGIAHGWSGFLYAALRWCAASGTPLPQSLPRRLEEFAASGTKRGRATYWRRQLGSPTQDTMPGWCNGSAGHVFLWTAAWDAYREDRYLQLAEEVALHTAEEPLYTADLCCGSAGRAYALLNLYKHTGNLEWLSGARRMANHAASFQGEWQRDNALWKGQLGVAVLIADLESPENARMPFFE